MSFVTIVNTCWIALAIYWAIFASLAKRAARGPNWRREVSVRLIFAATLITLIRITRAGRHWHRSYSEHVWHPSLIVAGTGVVIFAAGLILAIWARRNLGRNWGMPMTLRLDHELVTSGPYRFVRHPIYAGFLLAVIGSILVGEWWWLAVLPFSLIYFIYSAHAEEKTMTQQFPAEYPAYRRRTKMLVPFVF